MLCFLQEFPDVLECTMSHAVEKINPDEREEMKVSGKLRSFFLFFLKRITYLLYVYEYTVAVFRHTRRGHQIPL
jgi:hypothetical protein